MSFVVPEKRITKMFDLNPWYFSKAYFDYMTFLRRLNDAIKGVKTTEDLPISPAVMNCIEMLEHIEKFTDDYPPEDMGNQRFGNKSYRKWHARLVQESERLVQMVLPSDKQAAAVELAPYLHGAFGNATRIDYGSGHEASFLIFCLCLFKLNVFDDSTSDLKCVPLRVFNKYLKVCRKLQCLYRMEPAGSRGVHALDDFQFVPFMWGSSQMIGNRRLTPDSYTKPESVDMHSHESLFFEAIQYILQTKSGPFHEHSNQLWNISAVASWNKLNEGMFKMYEGEVLKAFPVVQHFLFGSLFSFDKREDAPTEPLTRQPSN